MSVLVIAEHDNQQLKPATLHTLSAALELNTAVDLLIIGYDCKEVAEKAQYLPIKNVLIANNEVYQYQLAENCAELIKELSSSYNYIFVPATTFGKNLLARVAALLDVAMVGDVIQIIAPDTFVRPIYAGNALQTVKSLDNIKLLSIRGTAFKSVDATSQASANIIQLDTIIPNNLSKFKDHVLTQSERPELTSAKIIISGGRGLKSAENFKLLESIADQLGAAIGASRAAVDAGFAPNDYQVGQTGKVVAPDLYIAVGISGAIQHLAGMKDSKIIVAINNDPEAPIFKIADYGLVGDLFKILPELEQALTST